MCGVGAIINLIPQAVTYDQLTRFTDQVSHRGPDGEGYALFQNNQSWWSVSSRVQWTLALSHKRLSILDLSAAGSQPMAFEGDQLWIVFNGEIYNYLEIRNDLLKLGYSFRSNSDTEVILAAYHHWGVGCFERFRGMWAIILFDLTRGKMIVSRDRLGIKPLYILKKPGYIAIASEIKQFSVLNGYQSDGNKATIKQYLLTGFERSDLTFFKDIEPVTPGATFEIDVNQSTISEPLSFWEPEKVKPYVKSYQEASEMLYASINESLGIHLRSDVSVGCQLSGGVDSSSIFSLMNDQYNGQSINSFTVSFEGYEKDESSIVKKMLTGSRAAQHAITPNPSAFIKDLDEFIVTHDEPVGSLSQYAAFVLSRLIKQNQVKVVLNGQGGDELFGGYWQQYYMFLLDRVKKGNLGLVTRQLLNSLSSAGNSELVAQMPAFFKRFLNRKSKDSLDFTNSFKNVPSLNYLGNFFHLNESERRIFEIRNLILPRLLKWDDRNLMRFSIEGRYPFLDHKVIETALAFDESTLYKDGWTKYPLRLAMKNKIPHEVCFKKEKWGFEVPQQQWLGKHLKSEISLWLMSEKPLNQIISEASIHRVAEEFWNSNKLEDAQLLFRLFITDRWLRKMNIHLE